jgi:ABC-2 type transport system permease protein
VSDGCGHALWQLMLARWRAHYREPEVLFWQFVFPVLLAIALGVAFRDRPPEPSAVAVEAGEGAGAVRDALAASPDVRPSLLDAAAARAALRTGKVDLVVVPGPPRTYVFDPARPESRMARLLTDNALQRADGRADPVRVSDVPVTEPGSRYIDFLLPGLIGMGLVSSGLWGVGFAVATVRASKLMKRMVATPMRQRDFLLSFVLTRAIFVFFELPVLLVFGALVFGVPVRGSLVLLTGVAVLGSLTFAGMGLLVASRARTTQAVNGIANLISMPMFIVSGTFFSASRFPDAVQPLVAALPLTALNDALRAVMLEGAGPVARPPPPRGPRAGGGG